MIACWRVSWVLIMGACAAAPAAPPQDAAVPAPGAVMSTSEHSDFESATTETAPVEADASAAAPTAENTALGPPPLEPDPRAAVTYRTRIVAWFNLRFKPPRGELAPEVLHGLSVAAQVKLGEGRIITGFEIPRGSGNAIFDARVRATLQGLVGQQLPAPPPHYPDLTGTLAIRFSGDASDRYRSEDE